MTQKPPFPDWPYTVRQTIALWVAWKILALGNVPRPLFASLGQFAQLRRPVRITVTRKGTVYQFPRGDAEEAAWLQEVGSHLPVAGMPTQGL